MLRQSAKPQDKLDMLTIEQLAFSFPGKTVLEGVSLNLCPHAVTCTRCQWLRQIHSKAIYGLLLP